MNTPTQHSPLIQIIPSHIGGQEANSVNARDLHDGLNVSKDFSGWIKAQIRRADLEENKDFALLTQKDEQVSGAKYKKEYLLTIESAKHIAMMSQSKKAKAYRDHFIKIERDYIAQLKGNTLALDGIKEELTAHIDTRLNAFEEKFDSYQLEHKRAGFYLQKATAVIDTATEVIQNLPLDKDQLKVLRQEATDQGRILANKIGISSESAIPAVFIKLNKHFDVSSYHEIPRERYYAAMSFLRTVEL